MAHITNKMEANKAFNIFQKDTSEDVKPTSTGIWLNIGMYATIINEEGIEEKQYISLPMNVSLDMIRNSDNYKYLTSGKNLSPLSTAKLELIEAIEKKLSTLDATNNTFDSKLSVQFYKKLPQEKQIRKEENKFIDLI